MNAKGLPGKLLPVAVLAGGAAIAAVLIATPPRPEQIERSEAATLVETRPANYVEQRFAISALGVVQPARDVIVQAQVAGVVVDVSDRLVPGGRFARNDILFQIDPTDYRIAVDTRRTQLAEAQANLALEKGRQEVARREWALFSDDSNPDDDPELALREPQLRAAEAVVAAAQAQLRQAEVNLERTTVRAPFNAVVRSESVELGQTISTQSHAAQLAGTDRFRVQASVPVQRLAFIETADGGGAASGAIVSYDSGAGIVRRRGDVVRVLSDLDPQGQMARVLIEIDDPLALDADNDVAPLLLESYVDVDIESNHTASVVELRRSELRAGDRVWIDNDGFLDIRQVNVVWRRENTVLIDAGIDQGERIVSSSLNGPVAGMRLRSAGRMNLADAENGTQP